MKRAKAHQLDAKAIRIVLQRRAMGDSKRDEQDYYVHSYEVALGGKKDAIEALERGEGVNATARATGLSAGAVSALKKGVQKSSFVNAATGEVIEQELSSTAGAGFSPNIQAEPPATDSRPKAPDASSTVTARATACGGVESRHAGGETPAEGRPGEVERTTSPLCPAAAGVAPGPQDVFKEVAHDAVAPPEPEVARAAPPATDPKKRAATPNLYQRMTGAFLPAPGPDDDLVIPDFLKRVPA
jgi:hypothetical protein